MLDRYLQPLLKKPLKRVAIVLQSCGISADQVTIGGFGLGVLAVLFVGWHHPLIGLALLLLNRIADGVDGELARLHQATDAGGFLDITLDFMFYALFPLGFALADPANNALPAVVLIVSFVGTGSSFLAFSSLAEKRGIVHTSFAHKSFYYLDGLAEGTETIACFALMCLFPAHFPVIALVFAGICVVTAINRVIFGYQTLRRA